MSDAENGLPFEPWDWGEEDPKPLNDLDTPKGGSELIREAIRQDLAPRTTDLVDAPLVDDVDGGQALAGFLLRATETGENAESCLGRLGDLEDLTEDERAVLARTRELLFNAAAWVYFDDDRARLADLVDDLERAVDAISAGVASTGAAASDVPDAEVTAQQNHLLELADREDAERWEYETMHNLAHIRSGLVNAELDALCEEPSGTIETYPTRGDGVPLGFEVTTDDDASVGGAVHLSAEQAEALAVDLLEQAHAARGEYEECDQE